jgi:hypothetical protein
MFNQDNKRLVLQKSIFGRPSGDETSIVAEGDYKLGDGSGESDVMCNQQDSAALNQITTETFLYNPCGGVYVLRVEGQFRG